MIGISVTETTRFIVVFIYVFFKACFCNDFLSITICFFYSLLKTIKK